MSNIVKSILVAGLVAVSLPSCGDDEPSLGLSTAIVGSWYGTAVYVGGQWVDITTGPAASQYGFTATFSSDGSYVSMGAFGSGQGTYKVSGDMVVSMVGGERFITYTVSSFTETAMEVTMSDATASVKARMAKR